jgi:hypothetical protein
MKPSKSPDRHTFQKEGYVERMKEKGEEPSQDYLDMFQKILEAADKKWQTPESMVDNMEYDLVSTDWILEKVRVSESYAQNLYAAICNNDFQKLAVIPILSNKTWSASWRSAGGIIADMRQEGDYIDWYCSGIRNDNNYDPELNIKFPSGYVPESVVTDEIREDLKRLGWIVVDQNDEF